MGRPRKFQIPSLAVLVPLYQRHTDAKIAIMFGCDRSTVKRWRRHYKITGIRRKGEGIGVGRRMFARPSSDDLAILCATLTDSEIAARIGCSRRLIDKWRTGYGLTRSRLYRRPSWAYDLDHDFFKTVDTEEKAYILGLLATDGCVYSKTSRVCLSLQARDEDILADIKRCMNLQSPILDRPKGSFPGSGPMKYISFSSRQIVADLAKLGVIPRKSKLLTYSSIPHHLERHYLRGLLDGDGSIHRRKMFYFLGTEALIDGVIDAVNRHTGISLSKRRAGKLWRASGYGGSKAVMAWIYEGSTIFLRRKRHIYVEHW